MFGGIFGGNLTFDHHSQEWNIYKRRFIQYCTANNITDKTDEDGSRRRAILLTALTEGTYRITRDLVFPGTVEDVSFKKLLEKLDNHLQAKKSSFAERYTSEQRSGEELAEWAARVRGFAQHCGFKSKLKVALRDRFVLGLENVKEKEKLFTQNVDELAQSLPVARLAVSARVTGGGSAGGGDVIDSTDVFVLHGRELSI